MPTRPAPMSKPAQTRSLWSSYLHAAGADAEFVEIAIELVCQRDHEVRERRFLRGLDVTVALDLARSSADQERRNVQARMRVAFAHAASIQNERMVEQRPVAVRSVLQPFHEFGEQADVVGIELHKPGQLLGVVAMVRH